MIKILKTTYYTKAEIMERLGCCAASLNKRIKLAEVEGFRMGRYMFYTEEQIEQLATCRPNRPGARKQQ